MTDDRHSASARRSPDALAEAASIVQEARRVAAMDAIDWTDNPRDEREAKLRAAIMRGIERQWGASSVLGPTWLWTRALQELAPEDAEVLGSDLFDEIERAERVIDDAKREHDKRERSRLMAEALREIDAG